MRFKTLLATTFCLLLPWGSANGDILAFDYDVEFNGSTVLTNGAGPGGLSGTNGSFTFSYGAGVLDLSIQLAGPATTTGATTNWVFSVDDPTGFDTAERISSVTSTGSFSPAISAVSDTGFSIATSGADLTTAGGLLQYSFAIAPFSAGSAAVPEPSSIAMLCTLGLGGVWVRRRRKTAV